MREEEGGESVLFYHASVGQSSVLGTESSSSSGRIKDGCCLVFKFRFLDCFVPHCEIDPHPISNTEVPVGSPSCHLFAVVSHHCLLAREQRHQNTPQFAHSVESLILTVMLALFQDLLHSKKLSPPRLQWSQGKTPRRKCAVCVTVAKRRKSKTLNSKPSKPAVIPTERRDLHAYSSNRHKRAGKARNCRNRKRSGVPSASAVRTAEEQEGIPRQEEGR